MSPREPPEPRGSDPRSVVAGGIQDLLAARLGRAFVPLAGLLVAGVARIAGSEADGWLMAVGAVVSGGGLLFYGLAVVQDALARPRRLWRSLAPVGTVLAAAYATYVLGWRGLRGLSEEGGVLAVGAAILYVALGVWVLRSCLGVMEVRRLARVMTEDLDDPPTFRRDGESA